MIIFQKNKNSKLSDIALVNKFKSSGNTAIIGILFERYYHLVYGVCLKYLQNVEESKDAVNQIFESLFSKLKENDVQNFNSWLYSVTKNHCLMHIRSSNRRHKREEVYEYENITYSTLFDNDIKYNEIKVKELKTALEKLKNEQKQCIELFFLNEKSYDEVSDITGFSKNMVKSHIQNGKRNLKIILEKNGTKR